MMAMWQVITFVAGVAVTLLCWWAMSRRTDSKRRERTRRITESLERHRKLARESIAHNAQEHVSKVDTESGKIINGVDDFDALLRIRRTLGKRDKH